MAYEEILTKQTGVSTEASQGLTDTQKANARSNIGAGTSSFSGNYNDLSNKPTITDNKVQSASSSANGNYPILLNNGTSATTSTVLLDTDVYVNPSSGNLHALQLNGVTIPASPKFTDTTYSAATTSANGLMSADDKSKLNGIAVGATANTGTVTSVSVKINGEVKGTVTSSGTIDLGNTGGAVVTFRNWS